MAKSPKKRSPSPSPLTEDVRAYDVVRKLRTTYIKTCAEMACAPLPCVMERLQKALEEAEDIGAILQQLLITDPLNTESVRALSEALIHYNYLQMLCFWGCANLQDISPVVEFLCRSRVQHLEFMNCSLSSSACDALKSYLPTAKLHLLSFEHNKIGDEGLQTLANSLRNNTALTSLNVGYCNLSHQSADALATIISCSKLRTLILRGNSLDGPSICICSRALSQNTILTRIDLADNDFANDINALYALRDAISINQTLKDIDLSHNFIGDRGAAMLADAIQEHVNISQLTVTERCSTPTCQIIVDTLEKHHKLQKPKKKKKKGQGK
mmetsp:Transcript_26657/g.43586  ORF Transcript_26657/g.43586 Transcript_26657/m.43586 type:complete len:327 (+) Transcript_26657:161-1141(+)